MSHTAYSKPIAIPDNEELIKSHLLLSAVIGELQKGIHAPKHCDCAICATVAEFSLKLLTGIQDAKFVKADSVEAAQAYAESLGKEKQ